MSFWLIIGLIGCIIRASLPDSTRQSGRIQQLKTHLSLLSELYEISNYQSHCRQHSLQQSIHKLVSSSPLQYSIPTSCLPGATDGTTEATYAVHCESWWMSGCCSSVPEHWLATQATSPGFNSQQLTFFIFQTHPTWHVVYCWSL